MKIYILIFVIVLSHDLVSQSNRIFFKNFELTINNSGLVHSKKSANFTEDNFKRIYDLSLFQMGLNNYAVKKTYFQSLVVGYHNHYSFSSAYKSQLTTIKTNPITGEQIINNGYSYIRSNIDLSYIHFGFGYSKKFQKRKFFMHYFQLQALLNFIYKHGNYHQYNKDKIQRVVDGGIFIYDLEQRNLIVKKEFFQPGVAWGCKWNIRRFSIGLNLTYLNAFQTILKSEADIFKNGQYQTTLRSESKGEILKLGIDFGYKFSLNKKIKNEDKSLIQ